jgi:acetyl-CoA decarbonylase/synthase complex subunit gamma
MVKLAGPLDIYPLLPGTNCGECGEANCMAFATKLAEYTVSLEACTPLFDEPKYAKKLQNLEELIRPPVREVTIGVGENAVKVGGKLVLYRHDLRYSNPIPVFIDIEDILSPKEIETRVKNIEDWTYIYIGKNLRLDGIAIRGVSQNPQTFAAAAKKVSETTDWPIILCSFDPKMLASGAKAIADKRPLLYAATTDTWSEVGDLAIKYDLPLVAYAPGDLDTVATLVNTLRAMGINNLIIDPGNSYSAGMGTTVDTFSQLRIAATKKGDDLVGYPLFASPISVWADYKGDEDPTLTKWNEVLAASSSIVRYADIMVMHSFDMWVQMPLTILRKNIYTDPVKPAKVEPGLMKYGNAGPDSPVMYTVNFALTFFTVESDIKEAGVDAWLVVIDTEGISVQSAVAGRKLTAEKVAEALEEYKVADNVNHRVLISPGMAARISGDTEIKSGWTVKVGPQDSSGIPKYLQEGKWK